MSDVIIHSSTPAQDLASIYSSLGYGSIGVDIFVWEEPDDSSQVQDNIITLYDTGYSKSPEVGYCYEYPTVQVRVRNKGGDQRAARGRVLLLMDAIHAYVGSVGAVNYRMVRVVNGPFDLGKDDSGRLRWTFNCELHRTV